MYQAKNAQKKLNPVDKERVEGMRKRVKQAMDSGNDRELKAACEDLTDALNAVGRYVDPSDMDDQDGAMDADIQN
jgi:uncharacterized protein (DUF2235 family)